MMNLWHWQELLTALNLPGPVIGSDIGGISIDTRTLQPGDLFIALTPTQSGNQRDGHEFLGSACNAGAAALLVSRASTFPLPTLTVPDTLDALWQLGRSSRTRMHGKVVGITGSAGKTTARYWLEEILRDQSSTHASTASYNNHLGVPLSLARMPASAEFGVFEIGMNQPNEIQPLSELVRPDVALVLNVLPAHIGNMGSLEAIRTEKLNIRHGLAPDGTLVVPSELVDFVTDCPVSTFGHDRQADVRAEIFPSGAMVHIKDQVFNLTLSVTGEHRLMTALGVLAVVHNLSADVQAGIEVIQRLGTPPGRGNHIHIAGRTIVDDSYNSNPVSMQYALNGLREQQSGRRIAILGEMLELGEESKDMHRAIAENCQGIHSVMTVGAGFAGIADSFGDCFAGHLGSIDEFDAVAFAKTTREGDVVLVKGSNKVFWAHEFVDRLASAFGDL